MAKYTLSSLVNALIRFEEAVARKLNEFALDDIDGGLNRFVEQYRDRVIKLNNYKGSMVIEMVLEPITGVDVEEKISYIEGLKDCGGQEGCIRSILKTYVELYSDVAEKIFSISIDVSMLLKGFVRKAWEILELV